MTTQAHWTPAQHKLNAMMVCGEFYTNHNTSEELHETTLKLAQVMREHTNFKASTYEVREVSLDYANRYGMEAR